MVKDLSRHRGGRAPKLRAHVPGAHDEPEEEEIILARPANGPTSSLDAQRHSLDGFQTTLILTL